MKIIFNLETKKENYQTTQKILLITKIDLLKF